ncbi:MAG TPA: hypothetical protein VN457_05035, partial [Chlamydiales bacterium]|nr:hypothetical protein [Chlamydiales bacterium]
MPISAAELSPGPVRDTVLALKCYGDAAPGVKIFLKLETRPDGSCYLSAHESISCFQSFFALFGWSDYNLRKITNFLDANGGFFLRTNTTNIAPREWGSLRRATTKLQEACVSHNSRGFFAWLSSRRIV